MRLFKTDLARNFAIGFIAGTFIVLAQIGPDMWTGSEQVVAESL